MATKLKLKVITEREAARKLAEMGWTMPNLESIPRRRSKIEKPKLKKSH